MSNGGIIGPVNIPTTNTASGIWTLEEQQLAKTQNIWPPFKDEYFEYTTLLLPGNGTNGAQNNTFLDSSTNNFTITRNGNTTQGTFSPFSQTGWGNYFNGTTAYLSIASNAVFGYGTNDFTIECFFYLNALPSSGGLGYIFDQRTTNPQVAPVVYFASSGSLSFYINGASPISGGTVVARQWNHLAVARSSGTTKMFLNGSQIGSDYSDSNNYITSPVVIASRFSAEDFLNGYVSNFRIVKGRAVYTSAFTPPTSPLTRTTGGTNPPQGTECSLLTCQSNRFLDSNGPNTPASSPLTITANGSPSVQAFSPFNPSASWSAATYGGSGYFDGSGDYLSVADNANLRLGTSAFTIQAWVYRNASGTAHSIIAKGAASTGYVLQVTSTNVLRFTHGTTNVDTTTTIPDSAWTHVAAVRTNTSTNGFQLYINGVSSATATVSTDFNQTDTLYIGSDRSAANVMNGYISGLKYTNGTAETISVPTEPPTATTNVALLTNFTNAGIYDATSKNDLETVGNAQISTAISAKWGSGSMYFDGTGDYLTNNNYNSVVLPFGSGDFTLEGWVYTSSSANMGICQISTTSGGLQASQTNTVALYIFNYVFGAYYANTGKNGGTSISSSTWSHFALVRSSGTLKLYVNGTADSTFGSLSDTTNYTGGYIAIGGYYNASYLLNGYLQDFRITRYARYTTNFTAPTAAFPTL